MAASAYLIDMKTWPQCPFDAEKEPGKAAAWWVAELERFEVSTHVWETKGMVVKPTNFREGRLEPYRHAEVNWFEARGTLWGKRFKAAIRADGSIHFEFLEPSP